MGQFDGHRRSLPLYDTNGAALSRNRSRLKVLSIIAASGIHGHGVLADV
jgi:hypothetical protein